MLTLGVILLVIGLVFNIPVLTGLGGLIALIGLILIVLGAVGREVGGRRHYY
ncbi:MAG: hypothetical protein R3A49_14390 [Acidimicrobiia bacterium]